MALKLYGNFYRYLDHRDEIGIDAAFLLTTFDFLDERIPALREH